MFNVEFDEEICSDEYSFASIGINGIYFVSYADDLGMLGNNNGEKKRRRN